MNDLEVYCGPVLVINAPYQIVRETITNELSDRVFMPYVTPLAGTTSYVVTNVKGPREFHATDIEESTEIIPIRVGEEILWFETEFAEEIKYFKTLFTEVIVKHGMFSFYM